MPSDQLSTTNENLYNVYTNLSELSGVEVNALTKQTSMMEMVKTENDRLTNKKNTIDQAVENQKRIIYFNDNSRKVSSAWLRIIITISIALGALFLVRVLSHHGFLPNMLFNILFVAIISITILVVYNYFKGIRARDDYNFDELKLKSPAMGSANETPRAPSSSIAPSSICIGAQCCTPPTDQNAGTQWNPIVGKCLPFPSSSLPPTAEGPIFIQPNESFENQYAVLQ